MASELVGRKQLDRNWALTASYVWSRLYGNYSGLSQSDENGRTDPNIGGTFDAPLALFGGDGRPLYGRLGRSIFRESAHSDRWPDLGALSFLVGRSAKPSPRRAPQFLSPWRCYTQLRCSC